jgi:phage baseplate assembly protein W
MAIDETPEFYTSFLGVGWTFPPTFDAATGTVGMAVDAEAVACSLRVLFNTAPGERLFHPQYGLDPRELLFEPLSTTTRGLLADRIRMGLLLYEPRIRVLSLAIDGAEPDDGTLRISLEYACRVTNSRYNLVFPFYRTDGNEVHHLVEAPRR